MGKILVIKGADFSSVAVGTVTPISNRVAITVIASPSNGGTVTGTGSYEPGEAIIISATPASGYIFSQWQDGNVNTPRAITVGSSAATYTALFETATPTPTPTPTTTWYLDNLTGNTPTLEANRQNGGWAFADDDNALLQGNTINAIRFIPSASGSLNIYTAQKDAEDVTLKATINVTLDDIGQEVTKTFAAFQLGANEFLVLGTKDSEAGIFLH